jgi:hypothetical protein
MRILCEPLPGTAVIPAAAKRRAGTQDTRADQFSRRGTDEDSRVSAFVEMTKECV